MEPDAARIIDDVKSAVALGRANAASMGDEATRRIVDGMWSALEDSYAIGVPSLSEQFSAFMAMLWPLFDEMIPSLRAHGLIPQNLPSVQPADAIRVLDDALGRMSPPHSVDGLMAKMTGVGGTEDGAGPMLIGMLGYFPEERRKLRRAAPGPLADSMHSTYALQSALFITGDERLAKRVAAWAHHTGRGIQNCRPPLIRVVRAGDRASFEAAAETVSALGEAFPEAAVNILLEDNRRD